ncbi:MAG TPA: MinD/ParA family protein [Candidatus Goldiibacteriota bacterium]|nr:MinD/ParA family protein [Candidatus Goldiibacteriota bacterium]
MDQAEKLRELVKAKREEGQLPPADGDDKEGSSGQEQAEEYPSFEKRPATKVIAIASGKGGVGKSNFTVNTAIELSKMGNRVMILDADLGLANVDILLGINPKFNLSHVIKEEKDIKDIITETEYGVKVIASGSGVKELVNLSNQQRSKFIEKIAELEDMVDVLLIDTGAGISKNTLSFMYAADYSIVITTPEPTALMDAYGLIKVVSSNRTAVPLKLIVNMVNTREEAKEISSRVILLSRRFLNIFVEPYGFIYRDKNVLSGVMAQKPFSVLNPSAKASVCIKEIADKISLRMASEAVKAKPAGKGNVFSRIFDFFKQEQV